MWNGRMMDGYGYGMMDGFGIYGIIFAVIKLLFWLVVIILIYKAVKKMNIKDFYKGSIDVKDNSLQILKERYAKGEISEEEYKRMKDILND